MDWFSEFPIWLIAALIFFLRIIDVTLGTLRTLSIVQGFLKLAVVVGFMEILIWVVAIGQVLNHLNDSFLLVLAYAGGFALGNAVGILLEKKLALGLCVVWMISSVAGEKIAKQLREHGNILTTFQGQGLAGPVTMIYITCPRKKLKDLINDAIGLDPELFYVVESAREWNRGPIAYPTGWRAVVKKK